MHRGDKISKTIIYVLQNNTQISGIPETIVTLKLELTRRGFILAG